MNRFGILLWLAMVTTAWPATRSRMANVMTNELWRAEMPTNIHALFQATIEELAPSMAIRSNATTVFFSRDNARPVPTNQMQWVARNLRTLESLRQIPWPYLDGWERVQFKRKSGTVSESMTNFVFTSWLVARTPQEVRFFSPDSITGWSAASTNSLVGLEPMDFREELRATLAYLDDPKAVAQSALHQSLRYGWEGGWLQRQGEMVRLAYDAAWHGHTNEARALLRHALGKDPTAEHFERVVLTAATKAHREAMQLTVSAAARSEMLAAWERFARVFPQSPQAGEAAEFVTVLRQQVAEFEELRRTMVENPEQLPAPARAEYYLARFPDVVSTDRFSSFAYPEGDLRGRVLKLGTAAIPALIAHLSDRRLARFNSGLGNSVVLRVQDLALECLRRITEVSFTEPGGSGGAFSTAKPEARDRLIREATEWWRKHADQPLLQGQLEALEKMPLFDRLRTLDNLERQNPGEVKAIEFLRKWAGTVPAESRHLLAEALARRGDLSLLPTLRAALASGDSHERYTFQSALLRYGGGEDYAAVRRHTWRDQLQSPAEWLRPGNEAYSHQTTLLDERLRDPATNFIAVPLLVDAIERFRFSAVVNQGQVQTTTFADAAMAMLIRVTGQAGDYRAEAPLWTRAASVHRWLETWDKSGRQQFVAAHPETAPVFFDLPITADSLNLTATNPLATVLSANRAAPLGYEVPRERLAELLKAGTVRGKMYDEVELFRFASDEAEEKWFTQRAPQWHRQPHPEATVMKPLRPTTMLVALANGAWPDSAGQVWAIWGDESGWPARYNGKRWRVFDETALPTGLRVSLNFSAAFAGERGAMFFIDGEGTVQLHDAEGWQLAVKARGQPLENEARVRQSTATFPAWTDPADFRLVKDAGENLWSHTSAAGLTVLGKRGKEVLAWPEKAGVAFSTDGSPWLLPTPNGRAMLAVSRTRERERVALFTAMDGPLRMVTEVTLPFPASYLETSVRDRSGHWWLTTRRECVAVDAAGKVVEQLPGRFLLEDSAKGRWLIKNPDAMHATVHRVAQDKSEVSLSIPRLLSEAAMAPDGTVWMVEANGRLLRLGLRKKELVVLETWQLRTGYNTRLWCDETGRVWCRSVNSFRHSLLTCIPAAAKAN